MCVIYIIDEHDLAPVLWAYPYTYACTCILCDNHHNYCTYISTSIPRSMSMYM